MFVAHEVIAGSLSMTIAHDSAGTRQEQTLTSDTSQVANI